MGRDSILDRLRSALWDRGSRRVIEEVASETITELCFALLSSRGEASGVALARVVLDRYEGFGDDEQLGFFRDLAGQFDPDPEAVLAAARRFAADPTPAALVHVNQVVEPPRQELLRRLNQAPGGTSALVRMRSDLLGFLAIEPDLQRVDADFVHLLRSWFNRGFLTMEPITWSSPADVLEKIIDYEAVHEITDWADLRRRLQPVDRRCYGFFHPALPGEPLVFVEVALTVGAPDSIGVLLGDDRTPLAAEDADTAVFYSISNCQGGLRGVSFGHFLIKQVASDLAGDLPGIESFVTLSPAPGFTTWLREVAEHDPRAAEVLELVSSEGWSDDAAAVDRHRELVTPLAATYFLRAKRADGEPRDPVARFHLGNGAVLDRINACGNASPAGVSSSAAMMVNYRYDLDAIERNHEAYATLREVRASEVVVGAADSE